MRVLSGELAEVDRLLDERPEEPLVVDHAPGGRPQ
jgi:hypothetical protein